MQLHLYWLNRIEIRKRPSIEWFSSSFNKCWTKKSPGIGSISTYSLAETTSSKNRWCRPPWNIYESSKKRSKWQKLSQRETCIRTIKHYSLSSSTCLSTRKTGPSTWKAVDILLKRRLSHSLSTMRTSSTLKLQMDHWWRSADIRSSNASDVTCLMSFARGMMKRYATWQNNITEVTTVTTDGLKGTIAPTSSGRIAVIAIIVTHTTSATRNRMTRFLLSTTTRRSSHAQCMGLRVNTPLRIVTRIQGMQNVNPMTGSICMKRITMTRATRAKMMSHAPALVHQPQWGSSVSFKWEQRTRRWELPSSSFQKNEGKWPCASQVWLSTSAVWAPDRSQRKKRRKVSYLFRQRSWFHRRCPNGTWIHQQCSQWHHKFVRF